MFALLVFVAVAVLLVMIVYATFRDPPAFP